MRYIYKIRYLKLKARTITAFSSKITLQKIGHFTMTICIYTYIFSSITVQYNDSLLSRGRREDTTPELFVKTVYLSGSFVETEKNLALNSILPIKST